jgi:hypothetical protein
MSRITYLPLGEVFQMATGINLQIDKSRGKDGKKFPEGRRAAV